MRFYSRMIAVAFSSLLGPITSAWPGSPLCDGKEKTVACLKKNYSALLRTDEARFYEILNQAKPRAASCRNLEDTVEFLGAAQYIGGGAATAEYFSEFIERLTLKKPSCVIETLSKVDEASQARLIEFLQNPTFVDKDEITAALQKTHLPKKYQGLIERITK